MESYLDVSLISSAFCLKSESKSWIGSWHLAALVNFIKHGISMTVEPVLRAFLCKITSRHKCFTYQYYDYCRCSLARIQELTTSLTLQVQEGTIRAGRWHEDSELFQAPRGTSCAFFGGGAVVLQTEKKQNGKNVWAFSKPEFAGNWNSMMAKKLL